MAHSEDRPQRLLLEQLDEPGPPRIEPADARPVQATPVARPVLRPVQWWRRPRAQAGLAVLSLALAAFAAVMLGTVHGLQRRVLLLQEAASKAAIDAPSSGPLGVWLVPGSSSKSGAGRLPETEVARGLRASLAVPSGTPSAVYIAVVRDAAGSEIWSSIPVGAVGGRVTITVPAGLLRRGEYRIVLRGGSAAATVTDVATYDVSIVE